MPLEDSQLVTLMVLMGLIVALAGARLAAF